MDERKIRVLIADDHEVVRIGLRSLLDRTPEIEVAGEAASAEEAVAQADALRPDVVVMDVRMPEAGGIEACRSIRSAHPQIKVIMLTSYSDDDAIIASVMAGASGYVLKRIGTSQLVDGIKTVYKGGSLLDPVVTGQVLARLRGEPAEDAMELIEPLTPRESELLDLIAQGMTNRQIGEKMHLSEKTVRNYVSNLLAKLQVSNRTQAAAYALRRKLGDEAGT